MNRYCKRQTELGFQQKFPCLKECSEEYGDVVEASVVGVQSTVKLLCAVAFTVKSPW